jgi:hypothetical protein
MDEQPPQHRPARPLSGYRDVGDHEQRHTREAHLRAWVILGVLAACYLTWTLVVYFFEPGLR